MTYANYPETVAEVIDNSVKYKRGVIPALKRWQKKRLWGSKTNAERLDGLKVLGKELSEVYQMRVPEIVVDGINLEATVRDTKMHFSGRSSYTPVQHKITMRGNLSIITFLHEFGHAMGKDERQTCRWSINLFRKVFPKQYAKLNAEGHTLQRHRPSEEAINQAMSG